MHNWKAAIAIMHITKYFSYRYHSNLEISHFSWKVRSQIDSHKILIRWKREREKRTILWPVNRVIVTEYTAFFISVAFPTTITYYDQGKAKRKIVYWCGFAVAYKFFGNKSTSLPIHNFCYWRVRWCRSEFVYYSSSSLHWFLTIQARLNFMIWYHFVSFLLDL